MKGRRDKARAPIVAAGGIVVRRGPEPLIAIVQLRKCDSWVLPKGKLNPNESAVAAARREVLEEVRRKVHIHEFLGTIAYDVGDRPKVVQFWRMQAVGEPVRGPMRDVKAVQWLPLAQAVEKLTRSREQAFLENVGPAVLKAAERPARKPRSVDMVEPPRPPAEEDLAEAAAGRSTRDHLSEKVRVWFRRISLGSAQPGR